MRIGFDFHNVLDAYPNQLVTMINHLHFSQNYVCVISAVGKKRKGTVAGYVADLGAYVDGVYEVVFNHPRESPALKTAKARELGLQMFFDDRQDVCDSMNAAGILCFKVPRILDMTDEESDASHS